MSSLKNTPETQEQHWSGKGGQRWLQNINDFEEMIQPIGQALLDCVKAQPGENFIDIGCGAGATTLSLGQQVGNAGLVLGIDISDELIAECRKRVIHAQLNNVSFLAGDAARIALPKSLADCLFSRFGVMFFKDPKTAFIHLRSSLKPGGRIAFSCWSAAQHNIWMLSIREVIANYIELPKLEPRAPGPFAFAEMDYINEILSFANFGNISVNPWIGKISIGRQENTPEEAAQFLLRSLSIAQSLNDELRSEKEAIQSELTQKLQEFTSPKGVYAPAQAWLVTATLNGR
jgi:ubiquinone/menaquinone biosynthesis C-methylase UbiE